MSLFLDRGDPIRAGYAGIEVKGGCNRVRCEGGGLGQKTKTKPWRLGFG